MLNYDDLEWFIMFPFLCGVMMWFSIDLALLVRIAGGRRRRKDARQAIESLVLRAPVIANHRHHHVHNNRHHHHRATSSTSPRRDSRDDSPAAAARGRWASQEQASSRNASPHRHHADTNKSDSGGTGGGGVPSPSSAAAAGHSGGKRYKKVVDIPTSTRIATKAITRRAVVVVGGDFARSPRMQYHAASLAQSGLFDEVVLVGLDCGNELSEVLRQSGVAAPETFYLDNQHDEKEVQRVVWEKFRKPHDRRQRTRTGCLISVRYLATPPTPPEWFQIVFPVRRLHWVACALYRTVAFTLIFAWLLARATAIRVNVHGQLLLTDLIMVQTPPAVPFVLLIKYLVRPMCFLYSGLVYYAFIVPASWFNKNAVKELRELCHPQTHPIFTAEHDAGVLSSRSPVTASGSCSPDGSSSSDNNGNNSSTTIPNPHRRRYHHQQQRGEDGNGPQARQWLRAWWRTGLVRRSVLWPAVIVDWHNLGHSILKAAGRPALVTNAYKFLEQHLCAGDVNVTVSQAMKHFLLDHGVVPQEAVVVGGGAGAGVGVGVCGGGTVVRVLYDVAPSSFRPASRRAFVEEVVLPINKVTAACKILKHTRASSTTTGAFEAKGEGKARVGMYNGEGSDADAVAAVRDEARVAAALRDGGWGINNPPAWVLDELAASLAAPTGTAPTVASGAGSRENAGGGSTSNGSKKRGIIIVGSTSWTDDDDYTILIEALQRLDHRLKHVYKYLGGTRATTSPSPSPAVAAGQYSHAHQPSPTRGVVVGPSDSHLTSIITGSIQAGRWQQQQQQPLDVWLLVTGKGPARQRFEDSVRAANFSSHVVVSTVYLQSYHQYSLTLGAADVGLCLHFSSSGLDLPMKGVDMVGCGLPVAAFAYPAVTELMGAPTPSLPANIRNSRSGSFASPHHRGSENGCYGVSDGGLSLMECERGWIFTNAVALEKLVGSFIGLDEPGSSGNGVATPLSSHSVNTASLPSTGSILPGSNGSAPALSHAVSGGGGEQVLQPNLPPLLSSAPPLSLGLSRLAAVRQRTRNAPRGTWEENWDRVLKPVLDEIL